MEAELKNNLLIIEGRKLKIEPLLKLLSSSDNLNEYAEAINEAVFSIAAVASFILTCPTVNDEDRTKGGGEFPRTRYLFHFTSIIRNL